MTCFPCLWHVSICTLTLLTTPCKRVHQVTGYFESNSDDAANTAISIMKEARLVRPCLLPFPLPFLNSWFLPRESSRVVMLTSCSVTLFMVEPF